MKLELRCGCGRELIIDGITTEKSLLRAYGQFNSHTCYTPPVEEVVDAVSSVGFQRVAEPEMDIGET